MIWMVTSCSLVFAARREVAFLVSYITRHRWSAPHRHAKNTWRCGTGRVTDGLEVASRLSVSSVAVAGVAIPCVTVPGMSVAGVAGYVLAGGSRVRPGAGRRGCVRRALIRRMQGRRRQQCECGVYLLLLITEELRDQLVPSCVSGEVELFILADQIAEMFRALRVELREADGGSVAILLPGRELVFSDEFAEGYGCGLSVRPQVRFNSGALQNAFETRAEVAEVAKLAQSETSRLPPCGVDQGAKVGVAHRQDQ